MRLIRTSRLVFFQYTGSPDTYEASTNPNLNITFADRIEDIPDSFCLSNEMRSDWKQRLAIAHRAVVAYLGAQPAHLSWVAYSPLYIAEIGCLANFTDALPCIYDCTTVPGYRGKGVYPAVLHWIAGQASGSTNRCDIRIYSDDGNKSSIKGIQKAGFTRLGFAKATFIFGRPVSRKFTFNMH